MVPKFRLVAAPKRRPTNTNMSMREMPVMISGLIMGILVRLSRAVRKYLLRSLFMPTAAAVPMTVEISAAATARISVLRTALRVSVSRKSSRYHLREKPEKTERLLASLKEKTSKIAMGAKRKSMIRAV